MTTNLGFRFEQKDRFAWITIDQVGEKVNKLTSSFLMSFSEELDRIAALSIDALVLQSEKPGIFIAGADISEIQDITRPHEGEEKALLGQSILNKLEALPFPTVAVINGACLGGGLELALSCTYRVVTDNAKTMLGLPEVNLGIIPGFGGTQRLPRLIGLTQAMSMILSGKSVNGKKAFRIKLADAYILDSFLEEGVCHFLEKITSPAGRKSILKRRHARRFLDQLLQGNMLGRYLLYSMTRRQVLKKTKGVYPAPLSAIRAVRYGFSRSLKKGLKREAKLFSTLVTSPISKNLIQLFFNQDALKKYTGVSDSSVQTKSIHRAVVLGGGLMGGGIAWLLSYRNISVRLKEIDSGLLMKGMQAVWRIYQQLIKIRRLSYREARLAFLKYLSGSLDYDGIQRSDIVIEAIVENIDVKKKVFQDLESRVSPSCILASNTSSLSLTEMATVLNHPERFVGMHFFSPVNRMPLVEVIAGDKTSPETIASVVALSKRLKKVPIVVKDCPGFLVNRILMPYVIEAVFCLQDGASIQTIDRVMTDFGFPIGPLALADEVGLDVGYKVAKVLEEGYNGRIKMAPLLEDMIQDDKLRGKKSGKGFYIHANKQPNLDIERQAHRITIEKKRDDSDCLDRMILMMVNEAARCLEERIVESPSLLDMAMIFGTGFPPFRGGLCRYADTVGIAAVIQRLRVLSERYGERFSPASYLVELERTGQSIYGNNLSKKGVSA